MKTLRDYFSWSQYYLWNTNKKAYYKRYCLGEEQKTNIRFNKGNELGDYKETGLIPGYIKNPDMLKMVGDAIDSLEIMEHKIEVSIGGINLLAYIDSGMENYSDILEYKTGKEPWDQNRVDLHEQLDFYATCYYIASGEKVIPNIKLIWAETEDIENEVGGVEVVYTGIVEVFERIVTKDDIVLMMSKIITSVNDIEAWEYKDSEVNEEDAKRYVFLKERMKGDKEECDLLNLSIQSQLYNSKVNYGKSGDINFTISETKKHVYSKKITDKEKLYKDEITQLKELAKKKNETKSKVSYSLRYNVSK